MKIPKLHKMKFMYLIFIINALNLVKAGFLQFRPLSAQQVYNVLRAAKREDAVPQGRVITQGIAAMSGFAAGIATGIGVPLFLNIDLANVTGITAMLSGSNSGSASSSQMQTQEICFNSRAANEINDNDGDDDVENIGVAALAENESGRSYHQPFEKKKRLHLRRGRALRHMRAHQNDEDNNNDDDNDEVYENGVAESENYDDGEHYNAAAARQVDTSPTTTTGGVTDTATSPTTGDTTQATSPGATNTQTNTNTGTSTDNGAGSGTVTETVTNTGTGGATNCIVIQKP